MKYAQIKSKHKMHLVFEAGEGYDSQHLIPKGHLSAPLCNPKYDGDYRMNCNLPLGNACKNCLRVYNKRFGG